ncbi:MAG: helix-turn-helix transcriptional regulator [Patescibacteria group bacterium]
MNQISLGEKIKKLRNDKDLTQEELARKANIPYATLMKIENGQVKNPTIKTIYKIAKALNISLDELIDEKYG